MSQALYRKWRPQDWDDVVGQPHVVNTLRSALAAGRISHAYLFAGPRGTGKTTTARLLAKAVNCLDDDLSRRPCGSCEPCQAVAQGHFLDLIEIDAASNTSVDDVRDLREKINFAPNLGRYKVYIIDEVHMLSTAAFNALLKTLEEPPPHAIFVLATTEVHKIPPTVLSRCQRHEFRRIPLQEIVRQLTRIAEAEGILAESEALTYIARQASGALRDAISLLDQLASTGRPITLALTQEVLGTATSQAVMGVVEAWLERQAGRGLEYIHAALDGGSEARQMSRQIVDYLRDLLLLKMGDVQALEVSAEMKTRLAQQAQRVTEGELLQAIRLFSQAATEGRNTWLPSLPLELAFLEALQCREPLSAAPNLPDSPAAQAVPSATPSPAPRAKPLKVATPAPAAPPPPAAVFPSVEDLPPESDEDTQANRRLSELWPQVLQSVRQRSQTAYGTLNSSTSRRLRGDQLILGFASELLKTKMERPENLSLLQEALKYFLGRSISVRCVVETARRNTLPQGVDENGMVATALRDLGGELVDIS